jgi:hypothetical protein
MEDQPPVSSERSLSSVYHVRVRGSYVVQPVKSCGAPRALAVVSKYRRMSLSQHPAIPSDLIGVQASAAELPEQLVLSSKRVEAVPVQVTSSSHPTGHTSEPSVSGLRSQVGSRRDSPFGTILALAYWPNCSSVLLVADSSGPRNVYRDGGLPSS